jgi:hypothetical protein
MEALGRLLDDAGLVAHVEDDGLSALALVVLVGATAIAVAAGELGRRARGWWAGRRGGQGGGPLW